MLNDTNTATTIDSTQSGASNLGPYIITNSGNRFYIGSIDPSTILIEDIAWSLAHQNRFTGHLQTPWSVAQHSLALALWYEGYYILNAREDIAGRWRKMHTVLLHDASEAYLSDIARPFKRQLRDYNAIEEHLHANISLKWDLEFPHQGWLKEIDYRTTMNEVLAFARNKDIYGDWGFEVEPLPSMERYMNVISEMSPAEVSAEFIAMHEKITAKREEMSNGN